MLRHLRPDEGGSGRVGGQGTPSPPPRARAVEDPVAAGRLLPGRHRRPPARSDPTCQRMQNWWPAILTALINDVDNARTEGFNRITKQVKRTGCGYRNMINYQRRILSHIAVTRPQRSAA